jgi:lambda family phage tail tape measure protein
LQNTILGVEEKQAKNKLDLLYYNKPIQLDEWQALEALRSQTAEMARQAQDRKAWATQGVGGGLKMGTLDLQNTNATWTATQVADFVKNAPKDISTSMASWFVDTLQGKKTDFQSMGISMAQSFLQKMIEGWLNQVVPIITNSLSGLFSGLSGAGGVGGSGFSSSFFDEMYSGGGYRHGGAFQRFGRGDVFHSPQVFPMAVGYGVMAEAGPEAVMPLTRIGGDLGGKGGGGGGLEQTIIVNNNAPGTQASAETQPNGDLIVTIDQVTAQAYARGGSLFKAINSGRGITRR